MFSSTCTFTSNFNTLYNDFDYYHYDQCKHSVELCNTTFSSFSTLPFVHYCFYLIHFANFQFDSFLFCLFTLQSFLFDYYYFFQYTCKILFFTTTTCMLCKIFSPTCAPLFKVDHSSLLKFTQRLVEFFSNLYVSQSKYPFLFESWLFSISSLDSLNVFSYSQSILPISSRHS